MTHGDFSPLEGPKAAYVLSNQRKIVYLVAFVLLGTFSFYLASVTEVTPVQASVLRMVTGLSAAVSAAILSAVAGLVALHSASAKAVVVAGTVGVGITTGVNVPIRERPPPPPPPSDEVKFEIVVLPPGSTLPPAPADPAPSDKRAAQAYYYEELVLPDGSRRIVRRACLPRVAMPEVCYWPRADREKVIVKRR